MSVDWYGKVGCHHTSAVRPSPMLPMASSSDGNSRALDMVQKTGW